MAGLTGRMSTVVKAKVSKLLDRAEDPAWIKAHGRWERLVQAVNRVLRPVEE